MATRRGSINILVAGRDTIRLAHTWRGHFVGNRILWVSGASDPDAVAGHALSPGLLALIGKRDRRPDLVR